MRSDRSCFKPETLIVKSDSIDKVIDYFKSRFIKDPENWTENKPISDVIEFRNSLNPENCRWYLESIKISKLSKPDIEL